MGTKPAIAQSWPSANAARTTASTDAGVLQKTLAFLSFQIDQATSNSKESNSGREARSTRRRCSSHQSAMSTSSIGTRDCNCSGCSIANQTCLENTQPRNRCPHASASWLQRAHSSLSYRPCRFLRAEVQSLRCSASQKNSLTQGGALTRQSSLAPSSKVDPAKKAPYVNDTEKFPSGDHFQTNLSGCVGCSVTERMSSATRR